MKRVLFIIDSLGLGGAQRQITTIASQLNQKGYETSVLCYSHQTFFEQEIKRNGVRVVWMIEPRPISRIIRVRRFVRKEKFDVVISFLHTDNILNLISAIGGKKWKVICGERSAVEDNFKTYKAKILGALLRFSDNFVCNSENARQMWMRHYPRYESKYCVIYNNVNLKLPSNIYEPLKDGCLHVVVAGTYRNLKNPIGMIEGIRLLPREYREKLRVDWYGKKEPLPGDTHTYDESQNLLDQYELHDVIKLHSESNDIQSVMYNADVIALFSWVEGLPNCICEGMMMGKPIFMSKVSDYNVLVDESNGALCNWDDYESIMDGFKFLIEKGRHELTIMGKNSKNKAELLFSPKSILNKWINLIES